MEPIYKVFVDPFAPAYFAPKGFRRWLAKFGFPVRREICFAVTNDKRIICNPEVLERVKDVLRARRVRYTLDASCLTAVQEVEP